MVGWVDEQNEGKWDYAPPMEQSQTMMALLGAVYGQTLAPGAARAEMANAQHLADLYASRFMHRDPKKVPPIQRYFARRLDY